jgi:hypothetical protein
MASIIYTIILFLKHLSLEVLVKYTSNPLFYKINIALLFVFITLIIRYPDNAKRIIIYTNNKPLRNTTCSLSLITFLLVFLTFKGLINLYLKELILIYILVSLKSRN